MEPRDLRRVEHELASATWEQDWVPWMTELMPDRRGVLTHDPGAVQPVEGPAREGMQYGPYAVFESLGRR